MNPMPSAAYYPQQNTRMGPRSVSEEEFNVPRQVSTLKLFYHISRIKNDKSELQNISAHTYLYLCFINIFDSWVA